MLGPVFPPAREVDGKNNRVVHFITISVRVSINSDSLPSSRTFALLFAMEFLSEVPQMVLSETPGKQSAFCADVFKPRPPVAQIQGFAPWGVSLQD